MESGRRAGGLAAGERGAWHGARWREAVVRAAAECNAERRKGEEEEEAACVRRSRLDGRFAGGFGSWGSARDKDGSKIKLPLKLTQWEREATLAPARDRAGSAAGRRRWAGGRAGARE